MQETYIAHVGKEANKFEEVEQGLVHDWDEVQLVFREPRDSSSGSPVCHQADLENRRTCAVCGATLKSLRESYCSSACRQRAYRERKRHAVIELREP